MVQCESLETLVGVTRGSLCLVQLIPDAWGLIPVHCHLHPGRVTWCLLLFTELPRQTNGIGHEAIPEYPQTSYDSEPDGMSDTLTAIFAMEELEYLVLWQRPLHICPRDSMPLPS